MTNEQIIGAFRRGDKAKAGAIAQLLKHRDFQRLTKTMVENHLSHLELPPWRVVFRESLERLAQQIGQDLPSKSETLLAPFEMINRDVCLIKAFGKAEKQTDAMVYLKGQADFRDRARTVVQRQLAFLEPDAWEPVYAEAMEWMVEKITAEAHPRKEPLLSFFEAICRDICLLRAMSREGRPQWRALEHLKTQEVFEKIARGPEEEKLARLGSPPWRSVYEEAFVWLRQNVSLGSYPENTFLADAFKDICRDIRLVRAVRKSPETKRAAMAYIYESAEFQNAARRIFRRFSKLTEEDRRDLYTDIIIKFISSILVGNYAEGRSLVGYFSGICRFTCLNYGRKTDREITDIDLVDDLLEEPDPTNVLHQLFEEEKMTALRDAMAQLPPQHQEVLKWRMAGKSFRSIAGLMGYKNADSAKATGQRARDNLRVVLLNDPVIKELFNK